VEIDELQNCPQPMPKSPSIWFSKFGDKKAGTSRSHDVGRYESKLINQDHTKTSRKPNKQTKNKKTQRFGNLVTSPKVRVGVETCFFWFGLITGLINLGGVETDQSVDMPKTCFCEETCYRIALISITNCCECELLHWMSTPKAWKKNCSQHSVIIL